MARLLAAGLTIASVVWVAMILVAPSALLSGNPRLVSAAATLYSGAGRICHQRAARSFHLAGAQLPVCGRCTGVYFSAALGAVLAWIVSRRPRVPSNTRRILLLAAIPTALSAVLEWSGVLDPSNLGRALCALPLGATAAWIFVQSLRAEARVDRIPETGSRIPVS